MSFLIGEISPYTLQKRYFKVWITPNPKQLFIKVWITPNPNFLAWKVINISFFKLFKISRCTKHSSKYFRVWKGRSICLPHARNTCTNAQRGWGRELSISLSFSLLHKVQLEDLRKWREIYNNSSTEEVFNNVSFPCNHYF